MARRMTLVRFTEYTRYDITRDCEVTQFCASISTGSYHLELPIDGHRRLRETRNQFKERVAEMIQAGQPPQGVTLG